MFTILSKSLKKKAMTNTLHMKSHIYIYIYIYGRKRKKLQLVVICCACYMVVRQRREREKRDLIQTYFPYRFFFLFNRCIDVCLFYSLIRKKIPITTYLTRDFGSDFIPNTSSLLSCYIAFALCPFFFFFFFF